MNEYVQLIFKFAEDSRRKRRRLEVENDYGSSDDEEYHSRKQLETEIDEAEYFAVAIGNCCNLLSLSYIWCNFSYAGVIISVSRNASGLSITATIK